MTGNSRFVILLLAERGRKRATKLSENERCKMRERERENKTRQYECPVNPNSIPGRERMPNTCAHRHCSFELIRPTNEGRAIHRLCTQ